MSTDHLFHLHILAGILSFATDPQAHKVEIHTYTKWIINTERDLAPLSQRHSEFSIVLTTVPLRQNKQTPHTLQTGTRSVWRKRALDEGTDSVFTEEQ